MDVLVCHLDQTAALHQKVLRYLFASLDHVLIWYKTVDNIMSYHHNEYYLIVERRVCILCLMTAA